MGKLTSGTIFIDLDGTLVVHNYTPNIIEDELLPGSVAKLKEWQKNNCIVLTTARSYQNTKRFLDSLSETHNFKFNFIICDLPTGKRILINDMRENGVLKADSFNLVRDKGISECLL